MNWKKKTAKVAAGYSRQATEKNPEEEAAFNEMRRKYAYAIGYLLVNNIQQSKLRTYFDDPANKDRYSKIKKFREDIIEARPKAKQWVDRPFYLNLKLGEVVTGDVGEFKTEIIVNDYIFKQSTAVVSNQEELEGYLQTISQIIESEKLWNDPDMALFDAGERDDLGKKVVKKKLGKRTVAEREADEDEEVMGE